MNFQKILVFFILCAFFAFALPATGVAELRALNDDELTEIYATGFSSFNITSDGTLDTARAWFNIQAFTYTEIDSLKLGYHSNYDYKDPNPTTSTWDEDWTNVRIGESLTTPENDFHANKFYFELDFTDIDKPDTRELKSVRFGFEEVEGEIFADFNSFSGTIDDGGSNIIEGHALNLGPATITSTGDGGMEFSLNIENYDKGYWVTFDDATLTTVP